MKRKTKTYKPIVMNNKLMSSINIVLLTFLTIGFNACNTSENQNNNSTNNEVSETTKIQTVEVVKPMKHSFTGEVLITGTAQAYQSVMIYAMESGLLTQLKKDIGDKVYKGETLAILKNPVLNEMVLEAKSALSITKANLKTKEAELIAAKAEADGSASIAQRMSEVYTKTPQLMTISELENVKAKATSTNAIANSKKALIIAQQEMIKAKEVSLKTAQQRLSFLTIRAPFAGIVTKRLVDVGSLLQSGLNQKDPQAIFEVQNINKIRLTLPVPESDAVSIQKGKEVSISFPELSGKTIKATIDRTSGVLDPLSKTMQVEIDLDNQDGKILTGMYAKVYLKLDSRDNILSLPVFSKLRYKNENFVMTVNDGIVSRTPIKIGLSDKDYFEVLNAELNENTQVIIKGKGLVKPGQQVKAIFK